MVRYNSVISRLDFGGNTDLDQGPGNFWRNFTIAILAMVKGSASPKICWLANLRLNELKAASADVNAVW